MITKQYPNIRNFEITSFCNLDCPICVQKTWKRQHLSIELLYNILEKNKDVLNNQAVWLHYRGEPLLHPRLIEIIQVFDLFNIKTRFSTNGILLNNDLINRLLETSLEGMVISVISNDENVYRELRGKNMLQQVKANVINLMKSHTEKKSQMKIQVMGLNYGQEQSELQQFIDYYLQLGIEVAIHKFSNRINQSRYAPENFSEKIQEKRLPCKWLFNDMVILSDGSVTTCYFDLGSKLILGNLKSFNYSITEMWNSQIYNKMRNEHNHLIFNGACKDCSDWVYEHPDINIDDSTFITIYNS
jgi:radical SAM protein with 4Fe4S-binding SPASM domain